MRILAAIRVIFARLAVDELFNTAAHDIIKTHILPDLEKDGADPELIAAYEAYSDPRNRLSKKFGDFVGRAMVSVLTSRGMNEHDVQDAAQSVVADFYKKKKWRRFKSETGPEGLLKFLTYIAKQDTLSYVRSRVRRDEREIQLAPSGEEDTEYEERLQSQSLVSPTSFLDEVMTRDTIRDLRKYMKRHLKKDWHREVFDEWMDMLENKSRVNLNQDLVEPISEKYKISFSTVRSKLQDFKKLMVQFFKTEYDMSGRHASTIDSDLGLEERIARDTYHRVIADWVLPSNPLCRRILFM